MDEVDERTRQRLERKARRQDLKRQRILAAAQSVVVSEGLEKMTTAAVAHAADISASTLYYYYSSRQALVDALAIAQMTADVVRMEQAMAAQDHPVDALVATVRVHVRHYANRPEQFFLYEALSRAGLSQAVLIEQVYPLSQRINNRLEARLLAGQADGTVHSQVRPRELANTAWCLAQGILMTTLSFMRSGGNMRFPTEVLLAEACANLDRGCRS